MPLFASLFGSAITALVQLFSLFMSYRVALKLAAYTAWIGVFGALLVSVFVCVSSLLGMLTSGIGGGSGGVWVSQFWVGLGMFIPSNASAVLACVSSVWISTSIYAVQKQGIFGFAS